MIKAVIFDMDGTLVDTIPVYMAAYIKILKEDLNLPVEDEQVKSKFGKKATDIMVELLEELGVETKEGDVAKIIDQIRDEFKAKIKELLVLPGVYGLLDGLRGKYKMAIATSSRPYAVDVIVDKFDFEKYFDAVVTGDDVTHSKPHPEIFLEAAKRLGVDPEECIVVEDAVYGIEAAKAAGMKSLGVATGASTMEQLKKSEPDMLVKTLEDFGYSILN
jgi:HAD superfamily hydrolase (TIGR01509 family)